MLTDILGCLHGYNVVLAWRSTHILSLFVCSFFSRILARHPIRMEISHETSLEYLWRYDSHSGLDTAVERGGGGR